MKAFQYIDARSVGDVAHALGGDRSKAQVLAGGSDLIQSMKDHIIEPERVINLKNIPSLRAINKKSNGHRFGAAVTLRDLAHNPKISAAYTALAQAAASVGTPQIRNVATLGGNLCQRPRCFYYRDSYAHCTKKGGSRCFVAEKDGNSKYNSIFGDGPCYIVHPSDLATALVALNATIHYSDGHHDQDVAAEDFFTLPKADSRVFSLRIRLCSLVRIPVFSHSFFIFLVSPPPRICMNLLTSLSRSSGETSISRGVASLSITIYCCRILRAGSRFFS